MFFFSVKFKTSRQDIPFSTTTFPGAWTGIVRTLTLRVTHAMIHHTFRTLHSRNCLNTIFKAVRCIVTWSSTIPFLTIKFRTILASEIRPNRQCSVMFFELSERWIKCSPFLKTRCRVTACIERVAPFANWYCKVRCWGQLNVWVVITCWYGWWIWCRLWL